MGRLLLRFIDFITDISGKVAAIVVVAGMLATIWGIVWTWAKNIDTVQKALFIFATVCFFVFFCICLADGGAGIIWKDYLT